MSEPVCTLCHGRLVREKGVAIANAAAGGEDAYLLAWVCTECSAAYPIGCKTGLFSKTVPLYENGKRYDA